LTNFNIKESAMRKPLTFLIALGGQLMAFLKRFATWLMLAALILGAPAQAGFPSSGKYPGVSSGGSPTWTPGVAVPYQAIAFGSGTKTFSGLNGGTNFPSGAVVIVGVIQDQGATTLSTPQIGGQTATIVPGAQDSSTECTLYQATMPASEPDTFSFNAAFNVQNMAVAAGYFTGLSSSTVSAVGVEAYGANSDPQTMSTSPVVPSSGIGVVMTGAASGGSAINTTAMSWADTTSSSGDVFAGGTTAPVALGLAHTATAGAWSPDASGVTGSLNFIACMAAGTWH
jgi:hypothetical protein